jgi:FtsZ-binding cell division protein ZapB
MPTAQDERIAALEMAIEELKKTQQKLIEESTAANHQERSDQKVEKARDKIREWG